MRKLGRDQRSRRRIIVVFLATVVVPSLILAYLGLRSIRQEEEWQGQIVVQNLRVALSNTVRSVEADLDRYVRATFDSLDSQTSLQTLENPFQLYAFARKNALVEEVFLLNQRGEMLFPRTYRAARNSASRQPRLEQPSLREYLTRGEEHEARGRLREALEDYGRGLSHSSTAPARLAFRVRIARCLHRAGALDEAREAYRRVLAEAQDLSTGEEIPYRLVALFQLADISRHQGKVADSFERLSSAFGELVTQFHHVEEPTFEYYCARILADLHSVATLQQPQFAGRLDSLSQLKEIARGEPARRGFLERRVIPSIQPAMRTAEESQVVRYAVAHVGDTVIHLALRALEQSGRKSLTVGLRLREPAPIASVKEAVNALRVGENIRVLLMDPGGSLLSAEGARAGTPILDEPLNLLGGTLTGYRLALVGMPGTPAGEITSRSLTLYYVLIGIVTVVILLGILFIYHETARERELARMKSEFISNVTHEIKTPIATIRTLADNVNEGWVRSPDKHHEYFRVIARESERLGRLVENTLDFSRIESGRKLYRKELVSPRGVIESTVERFRTLTDGQGVEMTCTLRDPLPPMLMDEPAIGQALMNLFDNAVKYSPEKKTVSISASVEGDELRIAVVDAGIGMDRMELSRIFEKFYRSEPVGEKKVAGSGIGLTLVKEIVEAHGGRVEVRSERNRGSTFTIVLPVARKDSHAHNPVD